MNFEKLTEILNQRGVDPHEYRLYLNYLSQTELSSLSQTLRQKGVNLGEYQRYLNSTYQKTLSLSPISNQEEEEEEPSTNEFSELQQIGYKLLSDSKLNHGTLNAIIRDIPTDKLNKRFLLQTLLRKRKIRADEFLELDQGSWSEIQEQPYRLRIKKGIPEFYLENQNESQSFGHYQVIGELARGGMGIVYKAYHPQLNQTYALKVLIAGEDASENALIRFHREIQTSAKLKHPGIIQVIDSGQEGGKHYFVMEFVEGKPLDKVIEEGLSIREGLILMRKSLNALHYAHTQGVVHRDLKPENILITKEGEPKIGDFGLARDLTLDPSSQKITHTGAIIGTPAYMSPEQAKGGTNKLDSRSDVYSVGVCLFQILTSKCPFAAPTAHSLFEQIIRNEAPSPSSITSTIHRDIDTIVLKALAKQPAKRYQTALSFAADIERFLEGYPILARPAGPVEKCLKWSKRNKQTVVFSLTLLLCCSVFFIYFYWYRAQELQQHFENALKSAQKNIELAAQIHEETSLEKSQKIQHLLETLNYFDIALSLKPKSRLVEKEKLIVAKKLIQLALDSEEYHLAHYVSKEIQQLNSLPKAEKKALKSKVEKERNRQLTEHIARFDHWIELLRSGNLEPGARDNAIFEIAKMTENEIYEKLIELLTEGTQYFQQNKSRKVKLDEFFETIVVILGRLENPKAKTPLLESLKKIASYLEKNPKEKTAIDKIQFMVALTQSLGNIKAPNVSKELQQVRFLMGQNSMFWDATQFSYRQLAKLDKIDEVENPKSNSTPDYHKEGLTKYIQGDYQEAILAYTKYLELHPRSPSAYHNRAAARFKVKEYAKALEDANKAIEIKSNDEDIYNTRGAIKKELKDYKGALKDYSKAIQINPASASAFNNRASLKKFLKDYRGAFKDYSQAILLDPQNPTYYDNRGLLRKVIKDYKGALKDHSKTISLNPNFARAYSHRGVAKKNLKDYQGAIADYNQALRFDSQLAGAYLGRGVAKYLIKDYKGAIRDYQETLRLEPSNITAHFNCGVTKSEQGNKNEALASYNKALALDPNYADALFNRGFLYYQQQNMESARKDLKRFLQLTQEKQLKTHFKRARQEIMKRFPKLVQKSKIRK